MDEQEQKDPNAFDEKCFGPRKALKEIGDQVKALMGHSVFTAQSDRATARRTLAR